jgi:hypothetical protein
VHVITGDGQVLRPGRASLFVLSHIGYPRLVRLLSLRLWVWLVELSYGLVARQQTGFGPCLFRDQELGNGSRHALTNRE